jgi:hypothetical protein
MLPGAPRGRVAPSRRMPHQSQCASWPGNSKTRDLWSAAARSLLLGWRVFGGGHGDPRIYRRSSSGFGWLR